MSELTMRCDVTTKKIERYKGGYSLPGKNEYLLCPIAGDLEVECGDRCALLEESTDEKTGAVEVWCMACGGCIGKIDGETAP
jgi:hypothetical protein